MIQYLLIDLFRVLIFPKDLSYLGDLDPLYLSKVNLPEFTIGTYFEYNHTLIEFLTVLKPGLTLCLYTAAVNFLTHPEVKLNLTSLFENIYSAPDLGMRKTDTESFQLICTRLGAIPHRILYVGDNAQCVEAAAKAGLKSLQYSSTSQIIADISALLKS